MASLKRISSKRRDNGTCARMSLTLIERLMLHFMKSNTCKIYLSFVANMSEEALLITDTGLM